MKARKIRLYPTSLQQSVLQRWMGAYRWTYNQGVAAYNAHREEVAGALERGEVVPKAPTIKQYRARAVNDDVLRAGGNAWALAVPYDVRDEGMRDMKKAIQSNLAKMRKQKGQRGALTRFNLHFKSRRGASVESVVIHSKHYLHKRGAYAALFADGAMRSAEPLPGFLHGDTRLQRTRTGKYYLCVLSPVEAKGENQAPASSAEDFDDNGGPVHATIALDPGVRTFMTGYDADGQVVEWGAGDMKRIYRLAAAYDDLQRRAHAPGVVHARRWRMRRAALRVQERIRDLVDEVHKRLAKWLCENYRVVLIPLFETQQMVERNSACGRVRKINSKTARAMLTWAHFRFRQRLQSKAREYPWCRVVVTDEAYTSKTCGRCGVIKGNLGGAKVFTCGKCAYSVDRDANGARNILLRHLTLRTSAVAA
jgi:putative transposase